MKKIHFFRSLAVAALMVMGSLAASASILVPFYNLSGTAWEGKYFTAPISETGAPDNWYAADFDDTVWDNITGPLILSEGSWQDNYRTYWVRCHFTLDELNDSKTYTFYARHDDGCVAYVNGVLIYDNGSVSDYSTNTLSGEALTALKKGDNVLAVRVSDTGGGDAFMDFGLYENDLQDIVTRADVPVTISNDATYPWEVSGTEARNGNYATRYSTSWLTMEYNSANRTELKFDWYEYNYSQHQPLQLYIDGVLTSSTSSSSWTSARFYLDAGSHVVAFRDSIGNYSYSSNRSGVRNMQVREILPLETAVLTANSLPITFTNNDTYPWTIEDGYIQNGNYGYNNTTSRISTTFTIDKTSKFSLLYRSMQLNGNSGNNSYHQTKFRINGVLYDYAYNRTAFDNRFIWGLEPGTYTIEIVDSVWNTTTAYVSQLKEVELSNNWIDVELATAGTLGYEVLYSGKADVLNDVEFLKISGPLNVADWTDIKNMTNLLALDLSEAQISEIPNNAFDGKSRINSVILPEGIIRIGSYAFRGTNIRRINIPSTVNTIAEYAFNGTPIEYVTFAEDCQLKTIDYMAFYRCASLQEIVLPNQLEAIRYGAFSECTSLKKAYMPNSVTFVGAYAFNSCTSLESIHFSDALTEIREWVCNDCYALTDVHLPNAVTRINCEAFRDNTSLRHIDLPETLNTIVRLAFYNCALDSVKLPINLQWLGTEAFDQNKNLKYIEFPSFLESGSYSYCYSVRENDDTRWWTNDNSGYRSNFRYCPAIETVVMRSATPPAISADPFASSRAKSAITLVVPSFSVVNYKLDTYWYQFGTIIEGDDVDYWKITSPLMLTNNRRMQGTPDVDLYYGGQLTVGGNAPFTMGQFRYYVSESNPGRLLNTCEAMTAQEASVRFSAAANTWYFFTPLADVALADIEVTNNASYVFRYYDAHNRAVNGASGSWKNVDTDKLVAGQGYIFHCNTACEIVMPVDVADQASLFATKDVTRTLTVNESETTANRSWNYVGNPYPCYYDIYYMDFTAPITVRTGNTYTAYSIADDDLVLRPMQSFFVQKPDAVDQIVFKKEGRQLTTSIAHGASARAQAPAAASRSLFNLQIVAANGTEADQTRVVLNEQAQMGYEVERDAAKFFSFDADVPQLFTLDQQGNSYAINERPQQNGVVALGYYAATEGYYTISAQRADGTIQLLDHELNKTVDLTQQAYTFHSEATAEANQSRFQLIVAAGGETNGVESVATMSQPAAQLYDLQGRKINAATKGLYIKNGQKVVK